MKEMLDTRKDHEEITRQIRTLVEQQCSKTLTLSTESCAICEHCAYPDAPCRHPDKMFPCIESYGILVTDLGRKISDYLYERGQCGHLVQSDSVRINIFISAYI